MNKLDARIKFREHLIKIARDSIVERVAEFYLAQYRDKLEGLQKGQQVPSEVPVGKDKFVDWLKDALTVHFPEVSGVTENEKILKEYASQVADSVAKSNTDVQNPLRDYIVSKEPIHIRASEEIAITKQADNSFTPSGSLKTENMYSAPNEHSRYCPDHPGVMLRRVQDNLYQCPISGDLSSSKTWKDNYDYEAGHPVKFEMGVHNQTTEGMNTAHPLLPFLYEHPTNLKSPVKSKPYDLENLYGVRAAPPERQELKYANILDNLTVKVGSCASCNQSCNCGCQQGGECTCSIKKEAEKIKRDDGSYSERGLWDNIRKNKGSGKKPTPEMLEQAEKINKQSKIAQQLFAATTMVSRQCPDHPGQQLIRLADNVRQCPLDYKIYDFQHGFTTEDGVRHNGGTVEAQNSFGPNFRLATASKQVVASDAPTVHEFLYSVLQHLPASAEKERKILNYKFQKGVSLEEAMTAIKLADELAKQTPSSVSSKIAESEIINFVREG